MTYTWLFSNQNLFRSRVHEHKDLGILIDSKLNFISHIEKQINKARGMLAIIRRLISGQLSQETLRILYMCLVRSHLDYGCMVYNPNYAIHSNEIESVQKQFLIYAMPNELRTEEHRLRPYNDMCNYMKLQSLNIRRINSGLLFIYNLL